MGNGDHVNICTSHGSRIFIPYGCLKHKNIVKLLLVLNVIKINFIKIHGLSLFKIPTF